MYVRICAYVCKYLTTQVCTSTVYVYIVHMYVRVHNMYVHIYCVYTCMYVCALLILYTCTNTLTSYLITYSLQVSDEEVYCRKDWHQTPRSTIVAIYAKNCVPEECTVEANETVVSQFCLQSV